MNTSGSETDWRSQSEICNFFGMTIVIRGLVIFKWTQAGAGHL